MTSPSKPTRNKRRRSQQCRGRRARNYYRAVNRCTTDEQTQRVVADATATGALANFRRQHEGPGY